MGTRADFYYGIGSDAQWLGSHAFDGDPATVAERLSLDAGQHIASEADWRESVAALLAGLPDATLPAQGWPWPWKDSRTTDYAYAWTPGHPQVLVSCLGSRWVDLPRVWTDRDWPQEAELNVEVFPDMTAVQNVRWDIGSGVIVIGPSRDGRMASLSALELIAAHQPREPSCVHSHDYGSTFDQPMSWCSTCKHSPVLAEWRRYWDEKTADERKP